MIEAERVELTSGSGLVDCDGGGARCPTCRSMLWGTHPMFGAGILFLRVGTLDQGEGIEPDAHFFIRSRHSWISIPEGVPAFQTLPAEGDAPLFGAETARRIEAARRA